MRRVELRHVVQATASWAVLGLALAAGNGQALAQAAPGTEAGAPVVTGSPRQDADPAPDTVADPAGGGDEIIVSGARESQQSANNRKRNARTATDSIVADDIGSFPDRNVNEAISRIPGVALSRNEFGEGEAIAVRGNGPDLTRVELDGIGVQGTSALAIPNQNSRSADLRELPAELVKSIDVVKGSTADMTEGSIGGTVQIKTRTGLDFDELFVTARAGVSQNSLGKDWTPDFNLVAADRFLDDRLGLIVSGTYSKLQNNGHNYETTTSGNRGYSRFYDFDGSPEKTFEYNLGTLGTDMADTPFANSTFTPRSLLETMAGAQTQAECFELLPFLPTTASAAARNQRTLEQRSCQAQWYDQAPSLIRNFTNTQDDERYSVDARVDFEITPDWTVFAKGTIANRRVDDQFRSRTPVTLFGENVAGTFVTTPGVNGQPGTRGVSPNAPEGYFLFNPEYGIRSVGNNPVLGDVLNVRPDSVVVDEAHNLTGFTLTNNSVNIDQISNIIDTKTSYVQAGTNYYGETWEIEAFVGMTNAESSRNDQRFARSYQYGDATLALQPNGLWDIQLPGDYDDTDPNNFVQLNPAPCIGSAVPPPNCIAQNAIAAGEFNLASPEYTQAQLPLTTPSFGVSYTPALGESSEKIAKIDVAYNVNDEIPFFTRFKFGSMYRRNEIDRWGNGGYTAQGAIGTFGEPGYVPAVTVPRAAVRGSLRACEPTATSIVDCNYGFVPNANPAFNREGVTTLTADQLRQLFIDTADGADSDYFGDLPNRGSLPPSWTGIRVDELFAALGGANEFMNFDCLKECVGSDGQVYAQPVTSTRESIFNVYAMFDFEVDDLPLGLVFNGNAGIRGVMRDVSGTGFLTLESIQVTPSYNPLTPDLEGGFTRRSFQQNTTLEGKSADWLPSVNLNLWAFDESVVLRVYGAKTVALPDPARLVASGTCTIDERDILDGNSDFGCGGRVGNPDLSPFTAWSYNASLEWYANRDTLFSVTYGKLDVEIGNPISVQQTSRPFAGSDQVDPGTGLPLSDFEFTFPTYADGPGYSRDIWEFQAKTAFTFLPSFLRYTGADANFSILSSAVTSGQQDPLTGDFMPVPNESKYTTNVSLWYDDSKFQARLTYQKRTSAFACITPCGGNNIDFNYPGEQWTNVRLAGTGYSPGTPRFIDGTTFIDAKMAYNINPMFQVYVEGRNLRKEAQVESAGDYQRFADGTPRVYRLRYGGRRVMAGVRFRFGG